MRTRCPVCNTVFRVTSEQLRVKAGKVRCGHCQSLFNAFDSLIDETAAPEPVAPVGETPASEPLKAVTELASAPVESLPVEEDLVVADVPVAISTEIQVTPEPVPPPTTETCVLPPSPPSPPVASIEPVASEERAETVEESTLAAREAGLVAARELAETPAYNRWAAGALSGDSVAAFDSGPGPAARWPFTLVAILLLLVLVGQLLHHFRTGVVQRWPDSAAWFETAGIVVPLPRNTELVSIESSDLQSDNTRGLLVLQATLRNRAAYAQAWPVLELTLTDTRDTVVSRRILAAADYLPPTADAHSFAAGSEVSLQLWIEAKELGAAGYRLYVFYP